VVRETDRRFLIVVGEASGDRHAARLVRALRKLGPCAFRGVAGPALRAEGVEEVVAMESLAVIGFSEIVARLPALLGARATLLRELEHFQPHAVVLVDYPGFNLRLGPQMKRRGGRIFYYIAPQVWAWHPERAEAMARWVDALAVVFRFEVPIFEAAGVPTHFVGHPLVDELAVETGEGALRQELGVDAGRPLLGLLPGSRGQELRRHLAPMIATAREIRARRPEVLPVIALAPGLEASVPADSGIAVVHDRTHAVQAFSTACVVASGTATLETALFGTPLAIVYRVGSINYAIARRLVTIQRIGLPNIVCGREVAPEFVQAAFVPGDVADAVTPWLADPAARAAQSAKLAEVRTALGGEGASQRAAQALWTLSS
jgi:lipid-A-disaccharide synthase